MENDPLRLFPEEKWLELQLNLKLDWPRSILIINLLKNLRRFPKLQQKFDYKIYCPYGDTTIGMVATCIKKKHCEVIIHCSRDLETLLNAVKSSRIINWNTSYIQFTDRRVMESVTTAMRSRSVELCHLVSGDTIYMDRNVIDVQIPSDVKFGHLPIKHLQQVNSNWPHRYPGSDWYFKELIKLEFGFGLFEKESNNLIAWVLYTELGIFNNFFVLDSYKKKGYGELLAKLVYNSIRKDKEYVFSFCLKDNGAAMAMFHKVGFKIIGETFWTVFKKETRSKI